jgi:hypothetical protein
MKTATRLTIKSDTSIDQVVNFLQFSEQGTRIRARNLNEGGIELYVRKDSFKQFFTDKLRFGCYVQQDYNAARSRILEIIKKADPAGENSSALSSIMRSLASDKYDFRADEFKKNLQTALSSETVKAKEILGMEYSQGDPRHEITKLIRNSKAQEEISKVMNSIKNPADRETFEKNFSALDFITSRPPTMGQATPPPTIIDYNRAIDFFRVWLKEVKETDSDIKNYDDKSGNEVSKEKKALTEFAERITRGGVPDRIDLNGGRFENSNADLIIFDESTSFQPFSGTQNTQSEPVSVGQNGATLVTNTYPEKHVIAKKDLTAGLRIICQNITVIDQQLMDSIYNKIEIAIGEKITSASQPMTGDTSADKIYTIHLPLITPFTGQDLKPAEKTMLQESFARATQKWTNEFPNLRIKVNLEGDRNVSSIQASYRNINKPQRTN